MQYQHLIPTRLHSVLAIFKSDSLTLAISLKQIENKQTQELKKGPPVTDRTLSYHRNMPPPPV